MASPEKDIDEFLLNDQSNTMPLKREANSQIKIGGLKFLDSLAEDVDNNGVYLVKRKVNENDKKYYNLVKKIHNAE